MLALDIMLVALAQSSVSTPQSAAPVARPDVEVVGPAQHNRVICRIIQISNSRIPSRRVCQTQAQIEEARDRAQAEAGVDLRSTDRRTAEMLETSGYGNWYRARFPGRVSETSVAQTGRGN